MGGWSPGKTAVVVVAVLVGLLVVCCGLSWAFKSDEIKDTASFVGSGIEMGQKMASSQQRFDEALGESLGEGTRWQLVQGASEGILIVGLGEAVDMDVVVAQDAAWAAFATAYADGSPPVSALALGRAGAALGGKRSRMGEVHGWTRDVIGVADLVERTGIEAPPMLEFFDRVQGLQKRGSGVRVEVR